MAWKLEIEPTHEPVTLAEAKAHLRIDDTNSDTYVSSLITAARMWCEQYCQRAFESQQWSLWLDGFYMKHFSSRDFPYAGAWPMASPFGVGAFSFAEPSAWPYGPANAWRRIDLFFPNVISIDLFEYKDPASNWNTLASNQYEVDLISAPPRIMPLYGQPWPQTITDINSVHIKFTAGYARANTSPSITTVPMPIRQAILLMVGDFYERRSDLGPGGMQQLPRGVEALLHPYKMYRLP